ncbi:hypothetical protein DAI22_06g098950 [Oryza sativa Japonica Group]|nr:hypothetical protein DAI22_06g098950 [Oryza sativa Japonica Group]
MPLTRFVWGLSSFAAAVLPTVFHEAVRLRCTQSRRYSSPGVAALSTPSVAVRIPRPLSRRLVRLLSRRLPPPPSLPSPLPPSPYVSPALSVAVRWPRPLHLRHRWRLLPLQCPCLLRRLPTARGIRSEAGTGRRRRGRQLVLPASGVAAGGAARRICPTQAPASGGAVKSSGVHSSPLPHHLTFCSPSSPQC